jgi:6-phosphogluconolactonase
VKAGHPVAVAADPAGRFLYTANAGDDSIDVLAIHFKHGRLKPAQHVPAGCKAPNSLQFDPTGRFLLVGCEESNRIVLFQIEKKTGEATPAGTPIEVPKPSGLQFVPVSGPEVH